MHPYKESTVPAYVLYIVGIFANVFTIAVTEGIWLRVSVSQIRNAVQSAEKGDRRIAHIWFWRCYKACVVFFFGLNVTNVITNIMKYNIGRLRPHFIDVCKPDYQLLATNQTTSCYGPYIEEDVCTGDEDLIIEARLSFLSGHSSISMYCAVFLALYLEKQMTWEKVLMLRPSLQTAAVCVATYVCCSRISDYKHHWSDVLAGAFLGAVIAYLMPLSKFLSKHLHLMAAEQVKKTYKRS